VFSRHKALKINLIHFDKERKMSKSFKAAAVIAVAAMFLAAPVFVQPVYGQESNKSVSTAGVFTSDVDDALDVINYSNVEFDKWFGFIGYGGIGQSPVNLGYATRFGDLYVGAYYSGNFLNVSEGQTETVKVNYNLQTQLQTSKVTTTVNTNTISSNNAVGVLIGVAGMGIGVGFHENVTEIKYPGTSIIVIENADGSIDQSNGDIRDYSNVSGTLTPTLQWGMSLDLDSVVIKPRVELGAEFGLDSVINNSRAPFTTINGEFVGAETLNLTGKNNRYVTPKISVGAGIDFEGFSLDVTYGIDFSVYDNSYDDSGFSGSTAGTVEWNGSKQTTTTLATTQTVSSTTLTIDDKSAVNHSIDLGYYTDKEVATGLTLGLYAGVGIGIDTSTSDSYSRSFTTTSTAYNNAALSSGNTTQKQESRTDSTVIDITTFSLEPFVNIGAVYEWFPGRFSINAGIALKPLVYTSTLTKTSKPNNAFSKDVTYNSKGDVISETNSGSALTSTEDKVEIANTWSYLSATFFGGFTFNFNDNMTLDLAAGTGNGSQFFNLNVANLNVLLSFKF
jgi:hypothetical protein